MLFGLFSLKRSKPANRLLNHLSIRFTPGEICEVAEFTGDIPDYCQGHRLTGPRLFPWNEAIVEELNRDTAPAVNVVARKDLTIVMVDTILILLAALAIKPKTKQQ